MNNAVAEIKRTLEGTNSRITEAEDMKSDVEDRMVEINETERKKAKRIQSNDSKYDPKFWKQNGITDKLTGDKDWEDARNV